MSYWFRKFPVFRVPNLVCTSLVPNVSIWESPEQKQRLLLMRSGPSWRLTGRTVCVILLTGPWGTCTWEETCISASQCLTLKHLTEFAWWNIQRIAGKQPKCEVWIIHKRYVQIRVSSRRLLMTPYFPRPAKWARGACLSMKCTVLANKYLKDFSNRGGATNVFIGLLYECDCVIVMHCLFTKHVLYAIVSYRLPLCVGST